MRRCTECEAPFPGTETRHLGKILDECERKPGKSDLNLWSDPGPTISGQFDLFTD